MDKYLTAPAAEFRHPSDEAPPLGTKLLILTRGGVCVVGKWSREEGSVAWSPMPKISARLREQLVAEGYKF